MAYILAGVLSLSGALGTLLLLMPNKMNVVQVLRDDQILYTVYINAEDERFIRIDYGDSYNLLEIKDGKIRVSEAGCPDNTCVKMSWLSSSAPIVCLPNHLVIKFASDYDGIDAVVG
ncbi:MAG: NusG domain II-containing protein [Ruminiclostridium sp.]|nr:NusG domain II-containing protein [Ruminiclostridium sp.]